MHEKINVLCASSQIELLKKIENSLIKTFDKPFELAFMHTEKDVIHVLDSDDRIEKSKPFIFLVDTCFFGPDAPEYLQLFKRNFPLSRIILIRSRKNVVKSALKNGCDYYLDVPLRKKGLNLSPAIRGMCLND